MQFTPVQVNFHFELNSNLLSLLPQANFLFYEARIHITGQTATQLTRMPKKTALVCYEPKQVFVYVFQKRLFQIQSVVFGQDKHSVQKIRQLTGKHLFGFRLVSGLEPFQIFDSRRGIACLIQDVGDHDKRVPRPSI